MVSQTKSRKIPPEIYYRSFSSRYIKGGTGTVKGQCAMCDNIKCTSTPGLYVISKKSGNVHHPGGYFS